MEFIMDFVNLSKQAVNKHINIMLFEMLVKDLS